MDISVSTTNYQVDDLSAKISHAYPPRTVTLDVSAFTEGTHYPNGYIPAHTAIAKITATGLYGPYANGGSGGLEVCAGLTAASARVKGTADVGAAMHEDGIFDESRLPFTSGAGAIDSAAKADLAGWFKFV
jgi:hypothetical protein